MMKVVRTNRHRIGNFLRELRETRRVNDKIKVSSTNMHMNLKKWSTSQVQMTQKADWKNIKGFLFDIDGTLSDTDPLHFIAFRDCLKKGGLFEIDEEFFNEKIAGRHNPDIAADLLPHLSESEKEVWIKEKERYFRELVVAGIEPVDGLPELLSWIKSNNLKCAAVTNAPRENAEMMLKGIGLESEFDTLVIANECERAKPYPDPYLTAMKILGLNSIDACAIEDSSTGASAAVAADVYTIGIMTSQPPEVLLNAGAKMAINNYHELLAEIKKEIAS